MSAPKKTFDKKRKRWGYKTNFTASNKRWRLWFPSLEQAKEFQRIKENEAVSVRHGLTTAKPKTKNVTLEQLRVAFASDKQSQSFTGKRMLDMAAALIEQNTERFPVAHIQAKHLRVLIESLQANDYADATVALYYAMARKFLSYAAEAFPLSFDIDWQPPTINMRRLPQRLRPVKRTRVLTFDELRKLNAAILTPREKLERMRACVFRHEHLADFFALQFLTCKRRSELAALRWSDVLFDANVIRFKLKKTHRVQMLPMSSEVRAIMERRKQQHPEAVWPSTMYDRAAYWYPVISRHAGVVYGENVDGGWVAHDLRHTAATYAVKSGANPSLVGFLLGHRIAEGDTATYTNLADADLVETLETIATIWRENCRQNDGVNLQIDSKLPTKATIKKAA